MKNHKTLKEAAVRAGRTFLQSFVSVLILSPDNILFALIVALFSSVLSLVMGIITNLPETEQRILLEEIIELSKEYGFEVPEIK